jgi:hypothetical protein
VKTSNLTDYWLFIKSVILNSVLYTSEDTKLILAMNTLFYEEVCVANVTGCIHQLRVNITNTNHPFPSPGEYAKVLIT